MIDFTANQVFVMKTLFPDLEIEPKSDLLYQPNPYVPAVNMPLELFRNALKYEGRFRASESGHWVRFEDVFDIIGSRLMVGQRFLVPLI